MGATSLVNVTCASAWLVPRMSNPRIARRDGVTVFIACILWCSARNGDLHESIRPTTLRVSGASDSRRVVRADAKQILSGLTERSHGRGQTIGSVCLW